MTKSGKEPVTKKFRIASRHAYPESQGAIFLQPVVKAKMRCSRQT